MSREDDGKARHSLVVHVTNNALSSPMRRQRRSKVQHDDKAKPHSSALDDCAVQPAHFSIPLKPQSKPTSFPSHFTHAVQDEYAIKYLQTLGAHPTADNIALVLEHLPLDACHIATAWKSRGSLSDVVTIDLHPHARSDVRKLAAAAASPQSIVNGGARRSDTGSHAAALSPRCGNNDYEHADTSYNSNLSSGDSDGRFPAMFQVGPVCLSFDDMKRQYLLPFKHDKSLALARLVAVPALTDAATGTAAAVHLLTHRASPRQRQCMEERAVPPDARADAVQQLQHAFFRALPLAALDVRDASSTRALFDAVVDARVTQLVQHTVRYLYCHAFVKLADPTTNADIDESDGHFNAHKSEIQAYTSSAFSHHERERLFVAVVGTFEAIKRQLVRDASGVRLLLPLVLLELRVAVAALFRIQYPLSFSAAASTMQYVLLTMDDTISRVLDPDAHLSRLGVLETTCEATRIITTQRRPTMRLRDQFFRTTEALHTIFPQPLAGKCRKVLALRGGASVANYPQHLDAHDSSSNGDNSGDGATVTRAGAAASVSTRLALLRIVERKRLHR